uniref:glycosyltransferase n=1 Tax=Lactococcus sp. TaxID=44273 RepID=UPI003242F5E1
MIKEKMKKIINIAQIPMRWLIHGIIFHRLFQLAFPNKVSKSLNNNAELEFNNLTSQQLNTTQRDKKITVSLTTIPNRIDKIKLVVTRMMNQTVRPDRIVLYIDEAQKEKFKFNDDLKKLIDLGLTVKYVRDIGPHTKYFYALQEYKNDIVITVDDDIIYSHRLIETLLNSYQAHPHAVSANIVTNFFFENGKLAPSTKWRQKFSYGVGNSHSIGYGVGGVLYPPQIMPEETFDEDKIRSLCLFADDLWLKAVENKYDIPVVKSKNGDQLYKYFVTVDGSQAVSLRSQNDIEDRNIQYLEELIPLYWRK